MDAKPNPSVSPKYCQLPILKDSQHKLYKVYFFNYYFYLRLKSAKGSTNQLITYYRLFKMLQ